MGSAGNSLRKEQLIKSEGFLDNKEDARSEITT
jgi:hypothetical protein